MATTKTNSENEQEKEDFDDIATSVAGVVVPPDGGWGWVVMVASFLCCVVVDGIVATASFMNTMVAEELKESEFALSFVTSLLSGFYLLAGPFVSALANRFGFRTVTIVGALFAAVCFEVAQFSQNVVQLYIVFSILGGIGFCMIYIPAVVILGFYFEKWRALATGVAMCGSGVGICHANIYCKDIFTRQTYKVPKEGTVGHV